MFSKLNELSKKPSKFNFSKIFSKNYKVKNNAHIHSWHRNPPSRIRLHPHRPLPHSHFLFRLSEIQEENLSHTLFCLKWALLSCYFTNFCNLSRSIKPRTYDNVWKIEKEKLVFSLKNYIEGSLLFPSTLHSADSSWLSPDSSASSDRPCRPRALRCRSNSLLK